MVCEAMGCETPEVPHPHSSHCEQDLPQREVGFLCSVNEDIDAMRGCYIERKHIIVRMTAVLHKPQLSVDGLPPLQRNTHHAMKWAVL